MSDLQQATKRLRNNTDLTVEDLVMLAKAYLAEHRADDGELITFPWIESIGGVTADSGRVYLDTYDMSFWIVQGGLNLTGTTHIIKTRGQLRQLCRALGVEIKEKTE